MGIGFGKLLTAGLANAKIAKGEGGEYLSTIMHLAPHKVAGVGNVCPWASPGCAGGCLNTAGRGRFNSVQLCRIARTKFYVQHRQDFLKMLFKELTGHVRRAIKLSKIPVARLNGLSDIVWEVVAPQIFDTFSDVTFYDYTKAAKRCMNRWALPSNYHLTFSRSEINQAECRKVLRAGRSNVAVVFDGTPNKYMGKPTFSMDTNDLRFLDPPGGMIGTLTAKGRAKKDTSGFVVRVSQ